MKAQNIFSLNMVQSTKNLAMPPLSFYLLSTIAEKSNPVGS